MYTYTYVYMYIYTYITYYLLPIIYCLLIAYWLHLVLDPAERLSFALLNISSIGKHVRNFLHLITINCFSLAVRVNIIVITTGTIREVCTVCTICTICKLCTIRYVQHACWLPLVHICSAIMDMGPGPKPKAQKLRPPRSRPSSVWALVLGPAPISIMAEHMCIKGNQ